MNRISLTHLRCVAVSVLGAILFGCDRGEVLAPPVVHYGQTQCAACRMIVSDERYAAAIIMLDERGRHQTLVFDDIGCIFEHEANNPEAHVATRYVRDASGERWLNVADAEFVHSHNLGTPMAFGLAAFRSLEDARSTRNAVGGELISFEEARRRFDAGRLHASPTGRAFEAAPQSEHTLELADNRTLRLSLATPQVLSPGEHAFEVTAEMRVGQSPWQPAPQIVLRITPEMPSMGHGSPGNEHPEHVGQGVYRGRVNFTMAGRWVVHLTVREGEAELDRTAFVFEVTR